MRDVETAAEMFKIFSDPTRLRLIRLLDRPCSAKKQPSECRKGTLCVNALAKRLGVTQSAVSQHLRILRQAGLVQSERHGSYIHYTLDRTRFAECKQALLDALEGNASVS